MAFRRNEKFHEIEGTVEHRTPKAILFWKSGHDKPDWIPLSQCELIKTSDDDGPAVLRLTDWIFREKGYVE